jgi:hypothetical protein
MNELSTVRGAVVDPQGRPVAEAAVAIVESTAPIPEIALLTDDAGRFSLQLPSGRFTLEAHGLNDMKGRRTIEVSVPETEIRIEVH